MEAITCISVKSCPPTTTLPLSALPPPPSLELESSSESPPQAAVARSSAVAAVIPSARVKRMGAPPSVSRGEPVPRVSDGHQFRHPLENIVRATDIPR